jgi:hypothetical protein
MKLSHYEKNLLLLVVALVLLSCGNQEPSSAHFEPRDLTVVVPEKVILGYEYVDLDQYLARVMSSEAPLAIWYDQILKSGLDSVMLPRLEMYVSVFGIAARSYALRTQINGRTLKSSEGHQVADLASWQDLPKGLKDLVMRGLSRTHNWILVDPVIDGTISHVALACHARTSCAPAPNGSGLGPYQGSHFRYSSRASVDEGYNPNRMGLSQMGLAQLLFGYPVGLDRAFTIDWSSAVEFPGKSKTFGDQVATALAVYYPNFRLVAPNQGVYRLDRIYGDFWGEAVDKLQTASISWVEFLGIEVTSLRSKSDYWYFAQPDGSNRVMYHDLPSGEISPGLGPEVGVYIDIKHAGEYEIMLRSIQNVRLSAYLYDEAGVIACTGTSRWAASSTIASLVPGRYILVVDTDYFDASEARQRRYSGEMPGFRISIKKT